jgi:HSP20 family molecular chaperone IbpA
MSAPTPEEGNAMARETRTDVQKSEKGSVPTVPEQTRPGPVYSPAVDIFENESSITVFADMPGVKAQDLKVDLRESVLTLTGQVTPPEAAREADVLREYESGTFFRQFSLSETIDQMKIDAHLDNGVLRLELPKVERARPRQISVRTA